MGNAAHLSARLDFLSIALGALGASQEGEGDDSGTLRFTADRPIPAALVRRIVRTRIEEIAAPGRR